MSDAGAEEFTGFEIAIIGVAGRFPGAASVEAFWHNLRNGVESVAFMSEEELVEAGVDPALVRHEKYVPAAALLDDIELFDAGFFGYTPREAEIMDPQHRLFLETAWTALENAGYDPSRPPGPIGVYGGTGTNAYLVNNLLTSDLVDAASLPALFGNHTDYLTTRVSYQLDLRGPSVDVQTSCSSSLVAVHLASQALLSGECDLALAGGSSITIPHKRGYLHQEQGIYSPDGHCRAFSSKAEGTAGGSGVALVALRRLEDALEAGDTILAVIKGSALNNDGSGKVGYAAPSVDGQAQVIRNALSMAEVEPREMGYIEAHGTGTSLGDPIEIAALTQAFRAQTEDNGFCRIGSVKTNIGHLDAAAGVTGLIKASLAVKHAEIPPSLNCDEPSPACDFPNTPFRVNTELTPWDAPQRYAGISSFGIGGTNAHVVVGQAPEQAAGSESRSAQLLVLSARTPATLDQASANLAEFLRANPDAELADVAYTLQVGRKGFDQRRAVVGSSAAELADALASGDPKRVRTLRREAGDRPVVFLFTGQGSQYVGMGRGLYETEPVFREHVDRGAELLRPALGFDLREVPFAPDGDATATEKLGQTSVTQPALFVIEHAMARLWMDWGVEPEAMIGHSIGEYVAATLAGVFDFETALALVAERGRLMQELPAGAMLAVLRPASEVEPKLPAELSLAAVNDESACVVSGPFEAIEAFERALEADGVASRKLRTSHAFHSAMMEPVLAPFAERVRAAGPKAPTIPFVSNLTGTWIRPEEATDGEYWAQHLRRAVRFADGVKVLLEDPERVLLEVGPGNTLTTLATRTARKNGRKDAVVVASMRHPQETRPDVEHLLDALGQLWLARVPVDHDAFWALETRRRIPLPTYPFARERYWVEPGEAGAATRSRGRRPDVAGWFYLPSWTRSGAHLAGIDEVEAVEVLLVSSGGPLERALEEELREAGKRVTVVERSVATRADADGLVAELERDGHGPELVLFTRGGGEGDEALDRGFYSLLHLAQALAARERSCELVAVTAGLFDVVGTETPRPEEAALLGAVQAIPQECPALRARLIDLDERTDARAADVLHELRVGEPELFVAWRGANRWTRHFEPFDVPALEPAGRRPYALRPGGHFLVTGGLGAIGLEVASVLAEAGDAKLTLLSRRQFPARESWEARLAELDAESEEARHLAKLLEVDAAAGSLRIESADVTDGASLRAALEAAEAAHGPLHGVVHAAGGDKVLTILTETTRADCEAQIGPKLDGLRVLEGLLEERPLDFCLVQSSLASCLGSLGMVGYVAAHHVADAFVAAHNRKAGTRWTSVNWDNWLNWREPEIAHAAGEDAYFMSPAEGAEAFRRALDLPAGTQVAVSTGDLDARVEEWFGADARRDEGEASAADLHARPDLGSEFEAPRDDAERAMARAWSAVLGIGDLGIHDSFFELGGDSVLGLQVVAKAAQEGYRITPAMIFEHSTIAELAAVAEAQTSTAAEQGEVTGTAPLVPVQHWFFGQDVPTPSHFNLPMMFEVPADAEPRVLVEALADVVRHHDALRMRYRTVDGAVEQRFESGAHEVPLEVRDLSGTPEAEREAAMVELATELHTSLDLDEGPLLRAALFQLGPDRPALLLWIAHHLLVDVVGWRTMIEDFHTAREARAAGRAPKLPPKSTSFQAWAEGLVAASQTGKRKSELALWQGMAADVVPLPQDHDRGPNVFASSRTVAVELDADKTAALLKDVPPVYETRIDEVLLTALVGATSRWSKARGTDLGDRLYLDLEGHGRESVVEGADLSRTVGWFTTIFPVGLSLAGIPGAGEGLKATKETLRKLPDNGIGFGMLRHLSEDAAVRDALAALPRPELNFLYLGQFDGGDEAGGVHLLQAASGPPCSGDLVRLHLFEVVAFVQGGKLRVELSYSENRHTEASARALLDEFRTELVALIDHCLDPTAGGRTPSDFPAAGVSQSDLDKLMAKIGKSKGSKG